MKILKVLGITLLSMTIIFLLIGVFLSGHAYLERTIIIDASPEKVYNQVNQFDDLEYWSPWVMMDPDAVYTFSGPDSGVGAIYTWDSEDPNIAQGAQEIVESTPHSYVKTIMNFGGMKGEHFAEFILEPTEGGTAVTWTYEGTEEDFFMRYFMAGTNMFLGPMYEEGLENLKSYVEELPD
jgi:hypothetical protein